jgi:hypothetical protein
LAINVDGKLGLYSRKKKSFHRQYVHIFEALKELPKDTAVDGEIVGSTTLADQTSTCSSISEPSFHGFAISCSFGLPLRAAI